MQLQLNEQALLVSLNISQWGARKRDNSVNQEIEKNHLLEQAGSYNKKLATSEELAGVRQAGRALRDFHNKQTLPWSDNGERLLPAANFFDYTAEFNQLRNQYESAVEDFVKDYDKIKANARRRLNGLYKDREYPHISDLAEKFSVKTAMLPAPTPAFNLPLGDANLDKLKQQAEAEIRERLEIANQDNWKRVREHLIRMKEVLASDGFTYETASGRTVTKSSPIRDSLFGDLSELVGLLPKLNITADPNLDAICQEMSGLLTVSADDVRISTVVRKEKARDVEAIMKKFDQFF